MPSPKPDMYLYRFARSIPGDCMGSMTLAVPEDLRKKMNKFSEMNWSAVARNALEEKVKDLEFIREFKAHSRMTEERAIELGREVRSGMEKKIRDAAHENRR